MKTILYMAMSLDGYIANDINETPWSDEEWESYKKIVAQCKNLIIGRKTYELMKKSNEFEKINNPLTIIVTSDKNLKDDSSRFIFVDSPQHARKVLQEKGFTIALVGGGQELNTAFLKEELLDEMYLDIEPFIFGSGISLFSKESIKHKLILLGINKYNQNSLQLHYKIEA